MILVRYQLYSGVIVELCWRHIGIIVAILALCCCYIRIMSVLYWYYTGVIWLLYWRCWRYSGITLFFIGVMVVLYWRYAGAIVVKLVLYPCRCWRIAVIGVTLVLC